MGIDPKDTGEATLSAARLAVAVRRASVEAGGAAALLFSEPIAIVGMGCQFPGGAANPDAYWRLLAEGRSGICEMPAGRWDGARANLPRHLLLGGYLDGIDRFDPEFFSITPREAHGIDPQQRLMLEVCWEALADAAIAPGALGGTDAGVFAAIYNSDYARLILRDDVVALDSKDATQVGIGAAHSVASGRLSFLLNLRGPCMTVDTACSSSLAATHLACQALRRRECGLALVAGVSLKLLPDEVRAFAQWGMLSSDGQAKTFDAQADGFVPGEGCGVMVLKRLSDAVAQGDRIRAVIRGTAVGHDGRSSVLTAPNGPAQEAVMRAALRDGQVKAGDVGFVETHGTGTSLGDPIEVEALDAVYGGRAAAGDASCVLGAVKTNFGHLEAAAGIAGLIKTVLVLEQGTIPRNLNFKRLNPQIRLGAESRIVLATEAQDWPRAAGRTRFAGVSSFGLGGTNAHVIVEEAPVLPRMADAGLEWCLPISAHTAEGLRTVAGEYASLLQEAGADLAAIARTAARGRDHGIFRLAVSGSAAEEVAEKLEKRLAEMNWEALEQRAGNGRGKLGFVFSGQGSLWLGALRTLENFPEAEKVLVECERLVVEVGGWALRAAGADLNALEDTAKGQPLLFAVQVALLQVLAGWGITPEVVAGHSVGEVAAAVAAGVLTLEEGMRLVLKRGRAMAQAGPGRMLAAELDEGSASALLAEMKDVELAAVNGPRSVVFAGPAEAMGELASLLETRRVPARWLDVQYAFHSEAMAAARIVLEADLGEEYAGGRGTHGGVALISTVTGMLWGTEDGGAAYWGRGIRERVRFREAATRLLGLGCGVVVEIGPHPVLLRQVGECAAGAVRPVATMRRGQTVRATLMAAVAALYETGWEPVWAKVYPGSPGHAELPSYPWKRERYWLAETPQLAKAAERGADGELAIHEIEAAFAGGRVFETRLGTVAVPWLGEHCWRERAILPFAAWLELARRAAATAEGAAVTLREFAVQRRLELGVEAIVLQTLATPGRQVRLAVRGDTGWQEYAGGFWEPADGENGPRIDLEAVRRRAVETAAPERLYRELEGIGLMYGPAFRLLRSVVAGSGFALGEIGGLERSEGLHPALLDACLQTLQAAQAEELRGVAVLPVSLRSYRMYKSAGAVFALAEVRSAMGNEIESDVTIVDRAGVCVAELRGLVVRRVKEAAARAPMWAVGWRQVEEAQAEVQTSALPEVRLAGGLSEVSADVLRLVVREREAPGSVGRISLTTRGAMVARMGDAVDPEQAALLGLARSLRAEYPAIAVQIVDLSVGDGSETRNGFAGWLNKNAEHSCEVAVRQGKLLTPRLERLKPFETAGNMALVIGTPGLLETLHETALITPELAAGEVEIAVVAHGLNFRDVLTAMGAYAGAAAPLGAECAGVVINAGRDSRFAAWDAVVAFAPGSLRSVVHVSEAFVAAKPAEMKFAEAATVPVAFLTAHYGFSRLAGLRSGQTVLVHSAAGGLGQAAVQLARRTGATVIATAGTAEKRELLRTQGIEHVFDSRTEEFAEDVLRATGGRGVDVVLNALSGEKIAAGFRVLKQGGTFLEVGKRNIWSAEEAGARRPDARYWAFDLGEVALREPKLIQEMLGEIFVGIALGELAPLPLQTYPMAEAEGAFRRMAGGKHTGKLVLMRKAQPLSHEDWVLALSAGTVLITGGTGALGLAATRWLLAQGALRIVLVSRNGELAGDAVAEFGERVRVERADVTDRAQMALVMERVRGVDGMPLRVVIHAAGVVEDRLLTDHTEESFAAGLRTKVEGARVLAELTADDGLTATIYFSSLTAIVGSAGQGSYAAANAYLDGLAEERNARGLRTLSVNWGAWGGDGVVRGMAERLSASALARVARQGMRLMEPSAALEALGEALVLGQTRVAIADVDWGACLEQFPTGSAAREFFAGFIPTGAAKAGATGPVQGEGNRDAVEIAGILKVAEAERLPRMETFVRGVARRVLGLSSGRPMPAETPLQEMGLDSLMALEMRNVLAQAMRKPLSATLLFDYPTIRGLAGYLLGLVEPETEAPVVRTGAQLEAELAAMSEAEAEALLLAELDGKGEV